MVPVVSLVIGLVVLAGNADLEMSRSLSRNRQWERATEYALSALREASDVGDNAAKAAALCQLSYIDLMTWRDEQAWEHACKAEVIAREEKIDTLLADALIGKGKVCVCSNVTGNESRDEEAIAYFKEALSLSTGSARRLVSINYSIADALVNINRLRNPVNEEIYAQAGEYIATAEKIANDNGLDDLLLSGLLYKIRYLRQGGNYQGAIDACKNLLASSNEDDYLARSQVYSQLVALYACIGKTKESVDAHQQYANATIFYMNQKSDELLQEMETKFQAAEKEGRISVLKKMVFILVIFVAILALAVLAILSLNKRLNRQKHSLDAANYGKEQLLNLVSKEFTNPSFNRELRQSVQKMSTMDDDGIRAYCVSLLGGSNAAFGEEMGDYFVGLIHERRKVARKFGLTAREVEILRCCREGLSNAQIADRLNISLSTVKNHKQNIFSKMNVKSVTEMLSVADESGLI